MDTSTRSGHLILLVLSYVGATIKMTNFNKNIAGNSNVTDAYTTMAIPATPSDVSCAVRCSTENCDAFHYDANGKLCTFIQIFNKSYDLLTDVFVRCFQCDCLPIGSMSAVHTIALHGHVTNAHCDMETLGGGWTVIQNRFNGSQEFYNTWVEYKNGFGDPSGEYWIGNEIIYLLTSWKLFELYIELVSDNGERRYVSYSSFYLSDESDGYRLSVSGFSGNVTDSMLYNNGQRFTTKDRDQDTRPAANCAHVFKGAWWYKSCHHSNLNAFYDPSSAPSGAVMCWKNFTGTVEFTPLKTSRMLIRPVP